jgi:hypothetical protein
MVKRIYEIAESEMARIDQWDFSGTGDPSSAREGASMALTALANCSRDLRCDFFLIAEEDGTCSVMARVFEDMVTISLAELVSQELVDLDRHDASALAVELRKAADRVEEKAKASGR